MSILETYIRPGLKLLPPEMDTREAAAMLIAIGFQESRFEYRKQIRGPARGWWQFEKGGGVKGVLEHRSTRDIVIGVCGRLVIPPDPSICHGLIAYHDALACVFARLLLWTLPSRLPGPGEAEEGWRQYIAAWRPGKPHRATWNDFYDRAWSMVEGG